MNFKPPYQMVILVVLMGGCGEKKAQPAAGVAPTTTTTTTLATVTTLPVVTPSPSASSGDSVGQSLELCNAQNRAWVAVVNNGQAPATCGDTLVSWCCVEQEIFARFPSSANVLENGSASTKGFKDLRNAGLKLYNCSKKDPSTTTFHWAAIDSLGTTVYQAITISNAFEQQPASPITSCTRLNLQDMMVAGTIDPTTSGFSSSSSNTQLTWSADISPIAQSGCSGSTCHSTGAPRNAYADNESVTKSNKTAIIDRLQRPANAAGAMPAGGKTITDTERSKLIQWLNQ